MNLTNILEVVGIVAFTLVGVLVGIEYDLDLFGIYAASFCSALAGGIIRDLCLGRVPPIAFTYYVYPLTVFVTVTAALIFVKLFGKRMNRKNIHVLKKYINIFDAIGLGMFTVSSCQVAFQLWGGNFLLVVFAGVITSIGGGVLRDLLVLRKPVVMRKDVYAVISLGGSILYFFIYPHVPPAAANYSVAFIITVVRLIAYFRGINMNFSVTNTDLKTDEDNTDVKTY